LYPDSDTKDEFTKVDNFVTTQNSPGRMGSCYSMDLPWQSC